jgi:nicotinamidase/pyrazinamidase
MARALLVVDVQRDFCEGGSLGVDGGGRVAAGITALVAAHPGAWDLVVATRDWHEDPGSHFAPAGTAPDFTATWPVHCRAGSDGAAFHPDLHLPGATIVSKGEHAAAFSGFDGHDGDGRPLADLLAAAGVDRVDVAGIATSYCVRATAIDARAAGLATRLLTDLCADVDPAVTPATLEELAGLGVEVAPGYAPPPEPARGG